MCLSVISSRLLTTLTRYGDPILNQCWSSVADAGPALIQYRIFVSFFLGTAHHVWYEAEACSYLGSDLGLRLDRPPLNHRHSGVCTLYIKNVLFKINSHFRIMPTRLFSTEMSMNLFILFTIKSL